MSIIVIIISKIIIIVIIIIKVVIMMKMTVIISIIIFITAIMIMIIMIIMTIMTIMMIIIRIMTIVIIIITESIYNEIKTKTNKILEVEKRQTLAYYSLLRETSKKSPFRFLMVIMMILSLIR